MNKSVLFLDDDFRRCARFRSECPFADIVNTAAQCIDRLRINTYDIVFLDHDLGGATFQDEKEENSGSGVVRWIAEHKPGVAQFIVHSLNPPARANMVHDLKRLGYEAQELPFIRLMDNGIVSSLTTNS